MGYLTVADIVDSPGIQRRVAACVVREDESTVDPPAWAQANAWHLPDALWVQQWEYYLAINEGASQIGDPGAQENVITDADILARVQYRLTYLAGGTPG